MSSYQIKIAEAGDWEALRDFFKEVYKPNHIIADYDYFAWQYKDVPGNQFFPRFSSLILLKDSQIIAHLGMIPYFFNVSGEERRAAYLTNLIARQEFRSRGAGVFLLKEAEKYFDLVYTTSYNAVVAPIYKSMLWSPEEKMRRWVRQDLDHLEPPAAERIITVKKFDEHWAKNWQELKRHFPATIERSPEYLNWRFFGNPKVQYEILGLQDGRGLINGFIALRLERGNDFSAVRIVDLAAAPEDAETLITAGLKYAGQERADFVDFFSTAPIYDSAFQKLKFYLYNNRDADPPIFILPTNRDKTFFNFSYKFTKNKPSLGNENLFVTKSDGDRDRPY